MSEIVNTSDKYIENIYQKFWHMILFFRDLSVGDKRKSSKMSVIKKDNWL